MTRLSAVLEQIGQARVGRPLEFVHVDCISRRTKTQWCHLVDASTADGVASSIERRWPDVKATVRR